MTTTTESPTTDRWVLEYSEYDPGQELLREALCTVGNGRFASRAAAPEHRAVDGVHYPGTYVAGLFNRLTAEQEGREIEDESLVNVPNWLFLTFRIDDGSWFSIDDVDILSFRQALEMDRGILIREVRFVDDAGHETTLSQRRLVHMARPTVAALETNIRAENWSGRLTIRSAIDGAVENRNVERYRDLPSRHLEVLDGIHTANTVLLRARTRQSRIEVVTGARHRVWVDDEPTDPDRDSYREEDVIGEDIAVEVETGRAVRFEKIVALVTSRDHAISEAGLEVERELARLPDFSDLEQEHAGAWSTLWRRFHLDVDADARVGQVTNLHIFHLMQVASPSVVGLDVGIPARGLHGEAYRGHIFWDELFVLPTLHFRAPEIARSFLRYRHRRLPAACRAAADAGYRGAMYPWQSGSDGTEETQEVHLNPRSGRWNPDLSHRQRHIDLAVAYNIVQYLRATGDVDFLAEYGAEMLIQIARFWASIAEYDRITDRFDIVGVMGPDEFHDSDPNWDGPGLRNNAYTNVMASWLLGTIPDALEPVPIRQREALWERLGFNRAELDHWDEICRKLKVPIHDGDIISQFEGYADLEEFDWEGYRRRYGDIHRLDRILESEDDTVNRYKASKQADVLMLFYLLSFEELVEVFDRLGVDFDEQVLARNIDYYAARTSHGSTLSRVVHSWVLARGDRRRSMELFREALVADLGDSQGGTTQEGIHLGAMAGTVDLLQRGYTGMEPGADGVLRFKPSLDPEIGKLEFCVYFRRRWIDATLAGEELVLRSEVTDAPPVEIDVRGERVVLGSGETRTFTRRDPPRSVD